MLDKAFMHRMFEQLETSTDAQLQEKIDAIEKHRSTFPKGSEASVDARFMLKHLRRELLERQFQPPA